MNETTKNLDEEIARMEREADANAAAVVGAYVQPPELRGLPPAVVDERIAVLDAEAERSANEIRAWFQKVRRLHASIAEIVGGDRFKPDRPAVTYDENGACIAFCGVIIHDDAGPFTSRRDMLAYSPSRGSRHTCVSTALGIELDRLVAHAKQIAEAATVRAANLANAATNIHNLDTRLTESS